MVCTNLVHLHTLTIPQEPQPGNWNQPVLSEKHICNVYDLLCNIKNGSLVFRKIHNENLLSLSSNT